MSRHRFVRAININDELAEDSLSDDSDGDHYENITPEQQAQLESGFEHIRSIVGPVHPSGITDREIKDALWDSYFDVEGTVDWLLEEQQKKNAAKQKKAAAAASSTPKSGKKINPNKQAPSQRSLASTSIPTPAGTPSKSKTTTPAVPNPTPARISSQPVSKTPAAPASSSAPSVVRTNVSQLHEDMAAMGLDAEDYEMDRGARGREDESMRDAGEANEEPAPKVALAREKVLEEARRAIAEGEKKDVSIVVIGHVDAGKSTLMGRLLYELGEVGEKGRIANERASGKIGKASFSWAWQMDGLTEERERGITMDISQTRLPLPRTTLTVLDAPGHRDFIPNMISGAAQADAALLVIDAGVGEFEAGFEGGGQSREHVLLVRSLGVTQVVVAVNKLDMVEWSKARFDEICGALQPFLVQSGFQPSKTIFIPCGAFSGVNLQERNCKALEAWYNGPTLVDALDNLTPPTRSLDTPLRFPISNVFKGGHLSLGGIGVSGRVCSGIVQAREVVRILPGQLSATIHSIELDSKSVPWAAAGSNVTLYLSGIDPNFLSIGSVICSPNDLVPVASAFIAQIIVFDIKMPITTGASVELFHHSRDNPATISKLLATVDRASGAVIKSNPRVLTKGCSARVEITLRSGTMSAPSTKPLFLPLETFSTNKEMGRVLLRRGGETIAAGIVTELFS